VQRRAPHPPDRAPVPVGVTAQHQHLGSAQPVGDLVVQSSDAVRVGHRDRDRDDTERDGEQRVGAADRTGELDSHSHSHPDPHSHPHPDADRDAHAIDEQPVRVRVRERA
jgi:hypothetical protein